MVAERELDQVYSYPFASALIEDRRGPQLALAATGSPETEPVFFTGKVRKPELAAQLLLATSEVALNRYYYPPGMVAAILRAADPVVTSDGHRLRFESFSQCCGVYARADFLPEFISAQTFGKGTTNVDFNPPMRAALSRVRSAGDLALHVTSQEFSVATNSGGAVEHKVKLPIRWLKGFAEVQALAAELEHLMTLPGPAARRFLAALPRQVKAREPVWLVKSGSGLRLSQRPAKDAVATASLGRLAAMKPLARHALQLRLYSAGSGTSAFELDFGSARFLIVLSPLASRGFSGEGRLLKLLAAHDAEAALARVKAHLAWQSNIEAKSLAREIGITDEQASAALALLAAQGLLGADPRERSYFHRVLPFDLTKIEGLHPRLKSARGLFASGAVTPGPMVKDMHTASVMSNGVSHRVRHGDDDFHCTCTWHAKTLGESGPCKHVLAAMLSDTGEVNSQ